MRDVDEILRNLRAVPSAPLRPPALTERPMRWRIATAAVALAATVAIVVLVAGGGGARFRGHGADSAVDLRMTVDRGGVAVRVSPDVPMSVGERVFFRLAAEGPIIAHLWVDGPAGREPIATFPADGAPRDVGTNGGLTGYRFERPGIDVFRASTEGLGICRSCPSIALEAR